MARARGGSHGAHLKTAIYAYLAPANHIGWTAPAGVVEYADTDWRYTTVHGVPGTSYSAPTGTDSRRGLSSGLCHAATQTGGWAMGDGSEIYRQALIRRGRPCYNTVATASEWHNRVWTPGSPGAPTGAISTKVNADGLTSTSGVCVYGESLVDMLGMFDMVILGDCPPDNLVQEIKRRSRRPGGTKVLLGLVALETINQYAPNNSIETTLRNYLKGSTVGAGDYPRPYISSAANASSTHWIDQGEAGGSAGTIDDTLPPDDFTTNAAHYWMIRLMGSLPTGTLLAAESEAITNIMSGLTAIADRYSPGSLDGIIIDNVLTNPYFGTASNKVTGDAEYVFWNNTTNYKGVWAVILRAIQAKLVSGGIRMPIEVIYPLRKLGRMLCGNTIGPDLTANAAHIGDILPAQMSEFFLHLDGGANKATPTTAEQMKKSLEWARNQKITLIGGGLKFSNSALSRKWFERQSSSNSYIEGPRPGTIDWPKVHTLVRDCDMLDNFYVLTARTSSGGILCYHPLFGPVV